jgi:outer membrane autotransporter protein
VSATSNDHLLKLSGTVGIDLKAGRIKITPFGGVDYAKGALNGFTETGADAADLTVARINVNRTDVLAGLNVTPSDGVFRPYVRAAYRSQIGSGTNPTVTAFFNGDPTTTFTVDGISPDRHQVDVDAGINLVYEDGAMFFGYQGTIRSNAAMHGFRAGLRFMF